VAVGKLTYQGTMEEKMKEAEHGRSILQKKLDAMTDLITSVSRYVSIALVLILCARMAYAFHTKKCCMEARPPLRYFERSFSAPLLSLSFLSSSSLLSFPFSTSIFSRRIRRKARALVSRARATLRIWLWFSGSIHP
jgi:L-cystine uptake protein TcyP (sodium:dicarboxylate symporter family)